MSQNSITAVFGLVCVVAATSTTSVPDRNGDTSVSELRSEQFEICYRKAQLSCPGSSHERSVRISACGFECPSETEYKCKKDEERGIIEFCAKPEICKAGQMNKVYFDDKHKKVVIEKDICQAKFFQPFAENCYTACTQFRHEDKRFLEVWGIKVLYHGNNTHAGVGYCDADHGYVSSEKQMYTSLEHKAVITCDKRDDLLSICGEKMRLLPDGNCGDKCENGYEVDIWNSFKCSKQSSDNRSVIFMPTSQVYNMTSLSTGSSKRSHIFPSVTPTTSSPQNGLHMSAVVVIVVSVSLLVIVLVIGCVVWRISVCRNRRSETRNMGREQRNIACRYSSYKTKNGNVNIYLNREDIENNRSPTGLMKWMKSLLHKSLVDVDREDTNTVDDVEQTERMKVVCQDD